MDPEFRQAFLDFLTLQANISQQNQMLLQQIREEIPHQPPPAIEQTIDTLAKAMREFVYQPEDGLTFESWFLRYEDLFGEDAGALDDRAKVRLLLRKLSANDFERYSNTILPRAARELTFQETIDALEELFGHAESQFSLCYKCLQTSKPATADYVSYGAIVNKRCEDFKLSDVSIDRFKCLIFVNGLQSPEDADIRTRLIATLEKEPNTTINDLLKDVKTYQTVRKDSRMVEQASSSQSSVVNKVQDRKTNFHKNNTKSKSSEKKQTSSPPSSCWKCGANHWVKDCTFHEHKCTDCNKIGHREGFCPKPRPNKHKPHKFNKNTKQTRQVYSVNKVDTANRRKFVKVKINNQLIRLQLDTASDISIVSHDIWKLMGSPKTHRTVHKCKGAGGRFRLLKEFYIQTEFQGQSHNAHFFISSDSELNLLGIEFIDQFGLWDVPFNSICDQIISSSAQSTLSSLRSQFASVFVKQPGHCRKIKVHLELKQNHKPVYVPARKVPYASIDAVTEELDRLEKAGIITPTTYSDWAAPLLATKRSDGRIRIVGDYSTGLNEQLKSHSYPLPVPDDIFVKVGGRKFYTQIDLSDAYMQIEADDETKQILTLNTHKGLYTFNRICPGIKSAPGAFQQTLNKILSGIADVAAYLDDVVIASRSKHNLVESYQNYQTSSQSFCRIWSHNKFRQMHILCRFNLLLRSNH